MAELWSCISVIIKWLQKDPSITTWEVLQAVYKAVGIILNTIKPEDIKPVFSSLSITNDEMIKLLSECEPKIKAGGDPVNMGLPWLLIIQILWEVGRRVLFQGG